MTSHASLTALTALAWAATVLTPPSTATAQEPSEPVQLDDILVEGEAYRPPAGPVDNWRALTADGPTRTRTPIRQIPQSLQVVPRQLIEEQDAQSVQDVLRNVPGVVINRDEEIFLNAPIIRGFEARTFFDGQPAFSLTNSADPLTTIQVERVEVIKGPSGSLFGGGIGAPLGGIINIVRKRPDPSGVFGEGQVDGGSFGNFSFGGDINVPITEDGGLRFRLQAEYRREESFLDDVESEQVNVFPALEVDLGDDTTISLLGFVGERDFIEYPGLPPEVVTFSDFDEDQFPGALNPPESEVQTASAQIFLDHEVRDGWNLHGAFQYLANDFDENVTFADSSFFDIDRTDRLFPVINGQLTNDVTQFTGNIWTTLEATTGPAMHRLLLGIEGDRTNYDVTTTFQPSGVQLDLFDPVRPPFSSLTSPPGTNAKVDSASFSVYAQDQITLWDDLHLTGSLRWTRLTTEDENLLLDRQIETTTDEFSPRAGITYDVTDEVSVFAGYGEGFQQVLFFRPAAPGDTPEPETSKQIEAGVKFDFDNGLSGSIAGFQVTRENVPVIASVPGNPFAQIQSGEQRARGMELELLWQPTDEFSLLANYTYQKAKVTEDTTLPEGDELFRVPNHFGRVAAHYRVLDGELRGLSFGAGTTASTGAQASLPNTFSTDSFAVVDARVGYKLGPAELLLSVENLLNTEYFVPYGFFNASVAPGQPRSLLATIRARF